MVGGGGEARRRKTFSFPSSKWPLRRIFMFAYYRGSSWKGGWPGKRGRIFTPRRLFHFHFFHSTIALGRAYLIINKYIYPPTTTIQNLSHETLSVTIIEQRKQSPATVVVVCATGNSNGSSDSRILFDLSTKGGRLAPTSSARVGASQE